MFRPSKDEYYIRIARDVAQRSTCLRRKYGAVLVKDDVIISTGYNGSARGEENCCDNGECWREAHNIPHGEQYEKCKAVHAEMNAVINAKSDTHGATLYLAGFENGKPLRNVTPCELCSRVIKNAGIKKIVTHWNNDKTNNLKGVPRSSGRYPWGTTEIRAVESIDDELAESL